MLSLSTDKVIDFSLKLTRIHKAALPNAVRFTLTDAARDVKRRTLKQQANKMFDVKKQSFFTKFSGYVPAKGFNISKMHSVAGMIKGNPKNNKSVASAEIAAQQYAGTLSKKSFWAAQDQKTSRGLVKSSYLKARQIKPIETEKGKNFFSDAKKAKETGRPLLVKKNNKGVLVKVGKVRKVKGNKNKREVVTKVIAGFQKDRKIKLTKKLPFVNMAALKSGEMLNTFFIKNAKKQIERFIK